MAILGAALSLNGTWEPLSRSRRAALSRLASRPEAVLFPDPDEAARLLGEGAVSEIVLFWRAGLRAASGLPGLALPFALPGGAARLLFALSRIVPEPSGIMARYEVKKDPKRAKKGTKKPAFS